MLVASRLGLVPPLALAQVAQVALLAPLVVSGDVSATPGFLAGRCNLWARKASIVTKSPDNLG
jgi:hypothetical protein